MAKNQGTLIINTIRPYDSSDSYASAFANEIQGGHYQVADSSARDAITVQRRVEGMLCYVISEDKMYRLVGGISNSNWTETAAGSIILEINSNTTALKGYRYIADSSGGSFTVTLPAAPVVGDTVSIMDAYGTIETNNITVNGNGTKIINLNENFIMDINYLEARFTYTGNPDRGWTINLESILEIYPFM